MKLCSVWCPSVGLSGHDRLICDAHLARVRYLPVDLFDLLDGLDKHHVRLLAHRTHPFAHQLNVHRFFRTVVPAVVIGDQGDRCVVHAQLGDQRCFRYGGLVGRGAGRLEQLENQFLNSKFYSFVLSIHLPCSPHSRPSSCTGSIRPLSRSAVLLW